MKYSYLSAFALSFIIGGLSALVMPLAMLLFWTLRAHPFHENADIAFFIICFALPATIFILLGSGVQAATGPINAYAKYLIVITGIVLVILLPYYLQLIALLLKVVGLSIPILGPIGMVLVIYGIVNGLAASFISCKIATRKTRSSE
ncbi:MAG: hypothetical protein PVH19_01255 [Planctomycetia bacterium]|jgi:hypothetical protein